MRTFSYLLALFKANMSVYRFEMKRFFVMSAFMAVQNFMFFLLWIIFFDAIDEVKGWRLQEMSRLYGVIAYAVGGALFFFNGPRTLAYKIADGSFDALVVRPRDPLPALLLSSSSFSSMGDIVSGLFIAWYFGHIGLSDLPLFLAVSTASMVIFVAMTVMLFSSAFWVRGNTRLPEQLFEMLIIGSCTMIHVQPFLVKLVFFTVLPAGFLSFIPVELIRAYDPFMMAVLIGAALFYALAAKLVFDAGLRRYVRTAG